MDLFDFAMIALEGLTSVFVSAVGEREYIYENTLHGKKIKLFYLRLSFNAQLIVTLRCSRNSSPNLESSNEYLW